MPSGWGLLFERLNIRDFEHETMFSSYDDRKHGHISLPLDVHAYVSLTMVVFSFFPSDNLLFVGMKLTSC